MKSVLLVIKLPVVGERRKLATGLLRDRYETATENRITHFLAEQVTSWKGCPATHNSLVMNTSNGIGVSGGVRGLWGGVRG